MELNMDRTSGIKTTSIRSITLILILVFLISGCGSNESRANKKVSDRTGVTRFQLKDLPDEKRVDILIDGELFTSYIYPDHIAKPVLYPIITASGKVVTRA